ncbi:MAG: CotH kinase family protein [Cyclobacteriaceae bacterium]
MEIRKFMFLCWIGLMHITAIAQIDHYETIVYAEDTWRFFLGTENPDEDWKSLNFDDSNWLTGSGGFGYGDGDDATIITPVSSLYLRITFNVIDLSNIEALMFHLDYDDAFVAYINEIEIARSGISVEEPAFDYLGESHEAVMKDGGIPEQFSISEQLMNRCLLEGTNVLTIQVHNASENSSDMSAIPFLSVAVSSTELTYRETPSWFAPPISFNSSDLPIVVITTADGQQIVEDVKSKAHMKIVHKDNGILNHINDPGNIYDGNIGIEIRGNYSAGLPQKPFGFETRDSLEENLNVPLFHMPEENDWILLANYNDKVMMRNTLPFHLFNEMGHYAPRTQYCDVVVNGSYEGIYILTEKIKQDKGRVAIAKLSEDDNEGDELTGGYIFKVDYFTDLDSWPGLSENVFFVYQDPKADQINTAQKDYIARHINEFESVLFSDKFRFTDTGYRKYIDYESFIDYFIISELSRNVDAYKKSKYYYKDKDSKDGLIYSGPVWDFDWAFKNINGDGADGSGWAYGKWPWMFPVPDGWINRLMEDPAFEMRMGNRYRSLRRGILSKGYLYDFIDEQAKVLKRAQNTHFERWDILGINVGAPEGQEIQPLSYDGEVVKFKNWLDTRLQWLDENMPEEVDEKDIKEEKEEVTLSNVEDDPLFSVFPNPSKDYFYINAKQKIQTVVLFNTLGQEFSTTAVESSLSTRIDLSDYKSGLYIVKVYFENKQYAVSSLIVR